MKNTTSLKIKRIIFLFTSFFLIVNSYASCGFENKVSNLGIGIVECAEEFTLFNDSLFQDTITQINLYESDLSVYNICGKFSKPDYGILHLVCLNQFSGFYKVLINSTDYAFVKKTEAIIFKSWNDYL